MALTKTFSFGSVRRDAVTTDCLHTGDRDETTGLDRRAPCLCYTRCGSFGRGVKSS